MIGVKVSSFRWHIYHLADNLTQPTDTGSINIPSYGELRFAEFFGAGQSHMRIVFT